MIQKVATDRRRRPRRTAASGDAGKRLNTPSELEAFRESIVAGRDSSMTCIVVCKGTGCSASGGGPVADAFREEIAKRGLQATVDLRTTGCHGFCERGPLVVIHPKGILYQKVSTQDVP
jgi:NADH-quinone oxidoreductase subunit F